MVLLAPYNVMTKFGAAMLSARTLCASAPATAGTHQQIQTFGCLLEVCWNLVSDDHFQALFII